MSNFDNTVYVRARALIFKVGGDRQATQAQHEALDELLGILQFLEDLHGELRQDIDSQADTIRLLKEEADSFDSVLAQNIMRRFANTDERLDNISSAIARLGAVVEGAE